MKMSFSTWLQAFGPADSLPACYSVLLCCRIVFFLLNTNNKCSLLLAFASTKENNATHWTGNCDFIKFLIFYFFVSEFLWPLLLSRDKCVLKMHFHKHGTAARQALKHWGISQHLQIWAKRDNRGRKQWFFHYSAHALCQLPLFLSPRSSQQWEY